VGCPARQFGVALLAVAGEPPGVDAVGLAEASERANEGLDLAGISAVRRHARRSGGCEQGGLVAAGGLADHEAVRGQALGEGAKSFGVVGELGGASGRHVENGYGLLADIAADDAGQDGGVGEGGGGGHGQGIL
jgi:hypothetical protein